MLRVIIIGAGLGGLACAIACQQQGLNVVVLEQAKEILPVGAGIVIPPNSERVMTHLGLQEKIKKYSVFVESLGFHRYDDGSIISKRYVGSLAEIDAVGGRWWVIHRADYHSVLLDSATACGVQIRLGAEVKDVDIVNSTVKLETGECVSGDVVISADGLWSKTREIILGRASQPFETGDLAYRATFSAHQLRALKDPGIDTLLDTKGTSAWWGPDRHAVFYPVKGGEAYNLVLLRPDDLPPNTSKAHGDLQEMMEIFNGWDPRLTNMMSCITGVLKWKLCHHDELETWCKNTTAILGDACHPTLPYQAQGAAMAVEDGAVIGYLLGRLIHDYPQQAAKSKLGSILKLYEQLRKPRTTLNVQGAIANRKMFHLPDGPEQQRRDADLKRADFVSPSSWKFVDGSYQQQLLGFDVIKDSERGYKMWKLEQEGRNL